MTHDLTLLQAHCAALIPDLAAQTADLQWLTTYAVEIRYPGMDANDEEARRSVEIAVGVRAVVRRSLRLRDAEVPDRDL